MISKQELIEILKQLQIDTELNLDQDVKLFLDELITRIEEQPHQMIELEHCPKEMNLKISSYVITDQVKDLV